MKTWAEDYIKRYEQLTDGEALGFGTSAEYMPKPWAIELYALAKAILEEEI